jgi:hypothetical protein
MCRTYGARGFCYFPSQRLRAGLTCAAPTALLKEANVTPEKNKREKPKEEKHLSKDRPLQESTKTKSSLPGLEIG